MAIPIISTKVDTSYKQILQISAPIWISILITQISFATNNYFLGNVGTSELAANGVGGIFYMVLSMICYGFANGVQVILSRRAGEEDRVGYGATISNALSLGMILVLIIVILSLLIAPNLFGYQIQNKEVLSLANQFMKIRVWGLPFYFLWQICNIFFISSRNTKYIIVGIIVSTLVNIGFDYAMINGHWGFAAMGIRGAAYASILSEFSFALVSVLIIYRKKLHQLFHLKVFPAINKQISMDSMQIASPIIIQYFFSIGTWMLFYFYVEHLGKDELAISQVLRSIFGLVGAASWALASSCNTMVGNLMGQKKYDEVFAVIKKNVTVSLLVSLVMGSAYLFFPSQIIGIYLKEPALVAKAMHPIQIVVVANFLLAISTVVFNAVLGTGNTRINMLIEFTAITIYIVYIYFVVEKYRMSLTWAWGSEFVYWSSILIMALSYLKWGKWKNKIV
jgi:multidrug resistance protein, MATE family